MMTQESHGRTQKNPKRASGEAVTDMRLFYFGQVINGLMICSRGRAESVIVVTQMARAKNSKLM
eukprot:5844998-Karenia_brevis.AAC.1